MLTLSYVTSFTGKAATKFTHGVDRFFRALIEARMRRAQLDMAGYRHPLPRDLEEAGWKLTERSEDSLPFTR
jgi:hypothetical protein